MRAAKTHAPRLSAHSLHFRFLLFCSFGVRNIFVIFFPFHQTTLSLNCNSPAHPFTYCASFASNASTRASSERQDCQSTADNRP